MLDNNLHAVVMVDYSATITSDVDILNKKDLIFRILNTDLDHDDNKCTASYPVVFDL